MSLATARNELPEGDNELQRLLRDSAATFARRGGLPRIRSLRKSKPGLDRAIWAQMAEQGWLGILVPESLGGQGLGFAEMAVVAEELARTLSPEPLVASSALAASLLVGCNNEALKKTLLPKIASGECIVGAGFAGRHGLDTMGNVIANARGSDVLLTGTAHHVYPALCANEFFVAARGADGLALYRVPARTSGLTVKEELRADGTYAADLTLQDVKAGDLIAKGAAAEATLRRATDAATVMTCAELFGCMESAFEMTLNYLKTRVQFGKPIGSFQALQVRCVELHLQKELARGALTDAVRTLGDPKATTEQVSMAASRAKSRCGDVAHLIGREAVKLHGAIGFTDEYDVGLFLRRAMTLNAWLGNPSEHRRRFGRLLQSAGGLRYSDKDKESVPFSAVFLSDDKHDVDWNSFSDREFRAGIRAYFEKNFPAHLKGLQRRVTPAEMKDWFAGLARKGWTAPAWPKK